jgi:hypothetical protein
VLALALVYNDFKTCTWLLQILKHEDDPEAVTPYNGQVSGMRIYALRMYFGLLHELLVGIHEAQKAGILRRICMRVIDGSSMKVPGVRATNLRSLRSAIRWRDRVSISQMPRQ